MGRGAEDIRQNFALRSARPGTWQRMPVFFYVSAGSGEAALESALAFTRGDTFKPLDGHQVMATHFHTRFVRRLQASGMDTRLRDLDAMKAIGINILGLGESSRGPDRLKNQADYFEGARRHSDKDFLIMPSEEDFPATSAGTTTSCRRSRSSGRRAATMARRSSRSIPRTARCITWGTRRT